MSDLPLVSICIPTFNAAEFFEPCLQSAFAQTYSNIEILISDDGSSDATIAIVENYQQQYPNLRLVHNAHRGMVHNWNNCIEQAQGEWVKFLFQDDILKPNCVQAMIAACLKHKADIGLCRREFIIHDDVANSVRFSYKFKLVRPEWIFADTTFISPDLLAKSIAEHLPQNVLGEPTCYIFHKRIIDAAGPFDTEFRQVVDYEFILRHGLKNGLVFINEVLALFRVHGKSASSVNNKVEKVAKSRQIAAVTGDFILLYYHFLHNPAFDRIKHVLGVDTLELFIKHYYHSGCNRNGTELFNQALAPIRKKYKELGALNFSIFKYIYYRKLYRKWEKQIGRI